MEVDKYLSKRQCPSSVVGRAVRGRTPRITIESISSDQNNNRYHNNGQ